MSTPARRFLGMQSCRWLGSARLGDELSVLPRDLSRPRTIKDFIAWQRVILDRAGQHTVDRAHGPWTNVVDAADEQTTIFPMAELHRVTPIDAEGGGEPHNSVPTSLLGRV